MEPGDPAPGRAMDMLPGCSARLPGPTSREALPPGGAQQQAAQQERTIFIHPEKGQ